MSKTPPGRVTEDRTAKRAETAGPADGAPQTGGAREAKEAPVPDLTGRAEQFGAIIVKTLDLAEAGLSLGLTVLTRAGAVAQEALTDRPQPDPGAASAHAPRPTPHDHPAAVPPQAPAGDPEGEMFFLANRVPLAPGGAVRVSFSITNDSLLEPKRVTLRVQSLIGDQHGVRIDESALTVRPARKTIPPMDFEKFVLSGTLPAAAPPDVYHGAVIVQSTDEMSIPVRLEVAVP